MNVKILLVCYLTYVSSQKDDTYYGFLRSRYGGKIHIPCDKGCGEPLMLTPLIEQNRLDEAKAAARVTPSFLPGVKSYSGLITVNKEYNSNLFITFTQAINKNVKEAPLLVTTRGGPGVAALYDIFLTIGPFTYNYSNNTIAARKYTWNANHSILYIDSPVGTGYSYTEDERGYSTNETMVAKDLYTALKQFLKLFPEVRSVPLYLVGDLYAAKHVVELGYQIHKNRCTDDHINLKGLVLNNGILDMESQIYGSDYLLQTGLLNSENADKMKMYIKYSKKALKEGKNLQAFDLLNKAGEITKLARLPDYMNFNSNGFPDFEPIIRFGQQPKLRKSIHVGNTVYRNVEKAYDKLKPDLISDVKKPLEKLLNNYVVLTINGNLSPFLPSHLAEKFYGKLNFKYANEYRSAPEKYLMYNGTVAGYYLESTNFITLCLRQTGNSPTIDQPELTLSIVTSFFANNTIS